MTTRKLIEELLKAEDIDKEAFIATGDGYYYHVEVVCDEAGVMLQIGADAFTED